MLEVLTQDYIRKKVNVMITNRVNAIEPSRLIMYGSIISLPYYVFMSAEDFDGLSKCSTSTESENTAYEKVVLMANSVITSIA